MKAEEIIHVYQLRLKKCRRYYRKLTRHFNERDNHNFRVEIKKLRAFIRLVNLTGEEHPQKITKGIKRFYHLAGDIRNIELHVQRIEHLCEDLLLQKPFEYLEQLNKERNKKRKELGDATKEVSFRKFRKRLIDGVPAELSEDVKSRFVQNSQSALARLLMLPAISDEALHEVRKLLKDLMYNYKYLEFYILSIIPFPLNRLETMEKLTSDLGDFHDLCLSLYFLSPGYLDMIAGSQIITVAEELNTHLQIRKENMVKELMKNLTSNSAPTDIQHHTDK